MKRFAQKQFQEGRVFMETWCVIETFCSGDRLNWTSMIAAYLVIGVILIPIFAVIDALIIKISGEDDEISPSYLAYVLLWPACLLGRGLNLSIRLLEAGDTRKFINTSRYTGCSSFESEGDAASERARPDRDHCEGCSKKVGINYGNAYRTVCKRCAFPSR